MNATVANGALVITAKKESGGHTCWYGPCQYTSTRITTQGKHEFMYGRIEARMKLPSGQGLWPAFWMLGSNIDSVGWPASGEIDNMEHINTEDKVYGTIHWDSGGHASYGCPSSDVIPTIDSTVFHIYAIEWDLNKITWRVDGTQYCEANIQDSINSTEEFHKPFFILLNLAVGGDWPGSPDANTVFPAKVYVDYVRVYYLGVPNAITQTFNSQGGNDGWVLESTETSGQGGSMNSASNVFYLGDNAQNSQYRSILHFNTESIPDNAIITKATLKIRKQGLVGINPFTTHQFINVDIRKGAFSNNNALQLTDFQLAANKNAVGSIKNVPATGNWYSTVLNYTAFPYINLAGVTQFRLRFKIDDDNDNIADYLKFYSGNAGAANIPQLLVEYYVP